MALRYAIAVLATVATSAPVYAQSGQSSGSVTVRLTIPPLSAAVNAARTGAVGGWTVTGLNNGLMIRAPKELPESGSASVDLFSGRAVLFSVESGADSLLAVESVGRSNSGGLIRTQLQLQRSDAGQPAPHGLPLLIKAI